MSERDSSPGTRAADLDRRPARLVDAVRLAAIHRRAALSAYADIFPASAPKPTVAALEASWRRLLSGSTADIVVAWGGAEPVGVVVVDTDDAVPAGLLMSRLYVDPDWWGRRIGSALHDRAVECARRRGHDAVNLWVLEENRRAREMYEGRGWRLVGDRRRTATTQAVAEVLYQLTLGTTAAPTTVREDLRRETTGEWVDHCRG